MASKIIGNCVECGELCTFKSVNVSSGHYWSACCGKMIEKDDVILMVTETKKKRDRDTHGCDTL